MILFYVVREIFTLEDAVSFNFALGAPYVKRRVKSRRPASAAPTRVSQPVSVHFGISIYVQMENINTALI